uniref:BHLH domain-containing protein n=1 Tax=Kalanchoe fedtschenkoi TaxID=63787 RepID=A0A7N0REC5_KALFE
MECRLRGEELECAKRFDPFEVEPGGAGDGEEVVADSGDEEMVKCLGKRRKNKKKVAISHIAAVALKNHREAERRRRERINAHLATLRSLLPSNNRKMDKAALLAEVINGVKDLQEHARRVSEGLLMPMDADELTVEPLSNESENGAVTFKASLCCDLRPDLFADLRQAIGSLRLKTLRSEISTLGERVKTLFILSSHNDVNDTGAQKNLANAILQALSSVLYKPSPLPEYSLRTTLSQKRFRASFEDYSSPRSVLSHKRFKYSFFESSSSSA